MTFIQMFRTCAEHFYLTFHEEIGGGILFGVLVCSPTPDVLDSFHSQYIFFCLAIYRLIIESFLSSLNVFISLLIPSATSNCEGNHEPWFNTIKCIRAKH